MRFRQIVVNLRAVLCFGQFAPFFARAIAVGVGDKVAGAINVRAFDWCAF